MYQCGQGGSHDGQSHMSNVSQNRLYIVGLRIITGERSGMIRILRETSSSRSKSILSGIYSIALLGRKSLLNTRNDDREWTC
mmetsp:Transcript_1033/g.2182  ORF Transcript_1033/g.2182 Transcript_1033/m.2182 type:complete len:82 (+) Transcript_1033:1216-1461(+)